MTYAQTQAAIVTHCLAAGAALSNPILDVQAGFPIAKGRCIRVYYGGEVAPERMGAEYTLNSQMVGEVTVIVAFFPITLSDETLTATIDADFYLLKDQLRTRILGDAQLGGASTDLELRLVTQDFVVLGNTRYSMGTWEVVSDFTEYTIAP